MPLKPKSTISLRSQGERWAERFLRHSPPSLVFRGFLLAVVLLVPGLAKVGEGTELMDSFDVKRVMKYAAHFADEIGPRPAGSEKVQEAARYFGETLASIGYVPDRHEYFLPDGRSAVNVTADLPGIDERVLILAGHLDTVPGSPGANDDGSGLGSILEIARVLREEKPKVTVRFAAFGSEEELPSGYKGHAYGSLKYLEHLSEEARSRIVGCVQLDKTGVGEELLVRYIVRSDRTLAKRFFDEVSKGSHPAPVRFGRMWARRMPLEKAGIPTAWVEWHPDPNLHRPGDVVSALDSEKIEFVARATLSLVIGFRPPT